MQYKWWDLHLEIASHILYLIQGKISKISMIIY